MITTFFFDLGGVLFTNGTKHFISVISEKYNLDPLFVNSVMDGEIGTQYRENKIDNTEFWRKAIPALGVPESADNLNRIWLQGYELIEGTRDIILTLRSAYKLYYLSDNVENRVVYLNEKYDFLKWFDDGVFSYEVDMRKPDPRIYQIALQKASANPNECVFVDDKQEALNPAKEMGMMTFLFHDANQLMLDLKTAHFDL